jgi:two-component system alkaline phosphatase synthesis response regulator PhoP
MAEAGKRKRTRVVLVVEDDRPIGELLAAIINDEDGYLAIHLSRPTQALEALREVKPDLFVLDVSLPGMSGLELYDRIKRDERLRDVPVVFETALSRDYRDEFKRRGIKTIIEKPFDVNDIVKTVHKLAPVMH